MTSEISIPLAEKLRPKTLDEIVGQTAIFSKGKSLRVAIETGNLPSIILWGPPGVGKTSIAKVISNTIDAHFISISAVLSGVKEIREIINKAEHSGGLFSGKSPILFIDEIHRFSKSQQDSLLNAVEKGIITLIGATTENPSFEVINALLSRCQVYTLNTLDKENLEKILTHALEKDSVLKNYLIELNETEALIELAGGDARKLLSLFELVIQAQSEKQFTLTNDLVFKTVQTNSVLFDKNGDFHYDIVSAFIKSIRGSDPNGAIYWLARMIEGGEDISFVARRMLILAAEDIGIANPTALVLANSTFQAVNSVGYPEGRILLSECALYLASSPKSNAAYKAINTAQEKVRETGNLPVPLHLRNAPTKLMKDLGYGEEYKYAHDYENQFAEQEFLPEKIKGTKLYNPGDNPKEKSIREFLKFRWKKKYGY